ncbi:hypothetical protein CYMTET_21247 [Cymbomonas tetramitiformis]|uniref:Integrase catalytic domain-containing protein n=1 Tax=Cymbomonas tetramitiformis TaxID=36881 RepID=A0AAE0G2J7_9CHLO|nr:hypothetical protein CYMTET_21247 [Cymbomonas tetramitiformis]
MLRWLRGERQGDPADHMATSVRARHYALEGETLIRILPNGRSETTSAASGPTFGCPAEVVTDNGGEWEINFAQLLRDNLIDHRTTSQSHPQSNGLIERIVQMTKAAPLTKACTRGGSIDRWDSFIPWIMLGYNATPQESTRLAPYELVYAQRPKLPPAIKERLSQPLDTYMDETTMAASYLERAEYVKRATIMAGSNIAIAQHRQSERYAQPKLTRVPTEEFWYCPRCLGLLPDDDLSPQYLTAYENRGKQLDSKRALKVIDALPYEGTIRWLGASERPYALKCEYDDGDTETFTLAELQQYVLPDNAAAPQKQALAHPQLEAERALHIALAATIDAAPGATAVPAPFTSLPDSWDLSDRQCMLRATATLLPGHWDPAHVTKLTQHIRQQAQALQDMTTITNSTVRHNTQ